LHEQNESFRRILGEPFPELPRSAVLSAVIAHATSFWTWHSLGSDNGLSNPEAVALMVGLAALGRNDGTAAASPNHGD
jgi:hypothetical protein